MTWKPITDTKKKNMVRTLHRPLTVRIAVAMSWSAGLTVGALAWAFLAEVIRFGLKYRDQFKRLDAKAAFARGQELASLSHEQMTVVQWIPIIAGLTLCLVGVWASLGLLPGTEATVTSKEDQHTVPRVVENAIVISTATAYGMLFGTLGGVCALVATLVTLWSYKCNGSLFATILIGFASFGLCTAVMLAALYVMLSSTP